MNKKISIIMPTLNSEKTIRLSLESIRVQMYPQELVEILVIDGGSTDATRKIAEEYGCKILSNPKVQQEYAKHIGILQGSGDIALFLDSDEVLESKEALKNRVEAFEQNPRCKIVLFGGYKKPQNANAINDYINIYSDPFAYFMYGISTENGIIQDSWKEHYSNYVEKPNYIEFTFHDKDIKPLTDMCAGNCMDLKYFRDTFATEINNPLIVPKIFYLVISDAPTVILLKNEATIHYSADSFKKFFAKLKWRVQVNIRFQDIPGTGYTNRENFEPKFFKYKKYFFIVYALTLVVPMAQALVLFSRYRRPILLIHPILTFYVAVQILWQYFLKIINVPVNLKAYGKDVNLKV